MARPRPLPRPTTAAAAAVALASPLLLASLPRGGLPVAVAAAASGGGGRGMARETLAGYEPTTDVSDQAAIDLDLRTVLSQLRLGTDDSFVSAYDVYNRGGHSGSYALLTFTSDRPAGYLEVGTEVTGLATQSGESATRTVLAVPYDEAMDTVGVRYPAGDGAPLFPCRVGALPTVGEEVTDGCYESTGTITIDGNPYPYTYDALTDTHNDLTLSSLSRGALRHFYRKTDACPGCPYEEFQPYYLYYRYRSYGHGWVAAALNGTATVYEGRGEGDFAGMSLVGRAEAARIGVVSMNLFMYVLRDLRLSVDRCHDDCRASCDGSDVSCVPCETDAASRAWDEAAALYVGSLQGGDGEEGEGGEGEEGGEVGGGGAGLLLHSMADDMCRTFRTCGQDSDATTGTANVNLLIMEEFRLGQRRIESGGCNRASLHADRISDLMSVPLIQGVLKQAYTMSSYDEDTELPKEERDRTIAAGATYAASILPRVYECDAGAAEMVYYQMRVGTEFTDYGAIRDALESTYDCLGIACRDVGGLYDEVAGGYAGGAEPCGGVRSPPMGRGGTAGAAKAAEAKADEATAGGEGPSGGRKARGVAVVITLLSLGVVGSSLALARRRHARGMADRTPAITLPDDGDEFRANDDDGVVAEEEDGGGGGGYDDGGGGEDGPAAVANEGIYV